jgi:hypothetical protein
MPLGDLLARLGVKTTLHGFRSAFSDWISEETHSQRETREAALAHRVKGAAPRSRSDAS